MPIQRRSDKHGPREDDELKDDLELADREGVTPESEFMGGTPEGLERGDVSGRSELARWLRPSIFPASARDVFAGATEMGAPDDVLTLLRSLPSDSKYDNVQHVWQSLGGGAEDPAHRP